MVPYVAAAGLLALCLFTPATVHSRAADVESAALATRQLACAPAQIAEVRTWRIRQTVALRDVPATAKDVRLWVALPTDGPWQRVLDRKVVEAPAGWSLEPQPESNGEMIYARTRGAATVVVETTVRRESPRFDLGAPIAAALQPELFVDELRTDEPLMSVTSEVRALADAACAGVTDPRRKVVQSFDAVANRADHYSKDPSKPKCGRGAAEDCMANGGGCCSDLHALFVACARSQGIPTRFQMGYRIKPEMAGKEYDPSYRCWVEVFLAGSGWVPTDLVVADSGAPEERAKHYGTLDAKRVWLWQGRSLELSPRQSGGPIQTMFSGWAEIDGVAVDVLPAADGTPSKLARTIQFEEIGNDNAGGVPSR